VFEEDELEDKNITVPHSKLPLIDPSYSTIPSLDELRNMNYSEVKRINNFIVSKDDVKMKFEHAVDLTDTNVKD